MLQDLLLMSVRTCFFSFSLNFWKNIMWAKAENRVLQYFFISSFVSYSYYNSITSTEYILQNHRIIYYNQIYLPTRFFLNYIYNVFMWRNRYKWLNHCSCKALYSSTGKEKCYLNVKPQCHWLLLQCMLDSQKWGLCFETEPWRIEAWLKV